MKNEQVALIPVESLHQAPDNPRKDVGDVSEMAASIAAQGLVQPLVVTPNADGYMVVAGARRLAAAVIAGADEVLCVVREYPDDGARIEAMLVENLQRTDLTPIEEGESFRMLVDLGKSQDEIAAQVGKSQSHISKRLSLVELPEPAKEALDSGGISIDDALVLRKLADHPERVVKAIADEKASPWRTMSDAVQDQLREQKKADFRTDAKERAKREGIKLVGYPTFGTKARLLGKSTSDAPFTVAQHKKEPCHALAIEASYTGNHKLVYVCTDVTRHNKKGASELKNTKDVKPHQPRSAGAAKTESKEDRNAREAEEEAFDAAMGARYKFLEQIVANMRGKKISKDEIRTVIAWAVASDFYIGEVESDICKALGFATHPGALREYAAQSPASLERAAFAGALFAASFQAGEFRWLTKDYAMAPWFVEFLKRHGYEFSDIERKRFGI